MSEYLSKKAVLEWLDDRRYKSPWIESFQDRLESGAFDADTSEIQRLRAALDWVKRRFEEEWTYELGTGEVVEEIIVKFEEALSTTTVQAERVKPFQQRLVELKHKYSSRNRGDGGMNWCEKHDHYKRTCPYCEIETLQERLDRVAAIVDVIEQHGDLDATVLTQLKQALRWLPDNIPDESRVYGQDCIGGRCEW